MSSWRLVLSKYFVAVSVMGGALLALVACATPTPETIIKEVVVEKEVSKDPGKLVIYVGRSETLVGPIVKQFAEVTGIDVQAKYGKTGAIAATLLEEGSKSPADIFFAQDPGGLGVTAKAGMLKSLDSDLLEKVPSWAQSKESKWIGLSGRARTVVYNTKNVSPENLPATIEGFTDPKWKGRIGWPPTNGSFQAMVTAMLVEWGEERTRKWLEGILSLIHI